MYQGFLEVPLGEPSAAFACMGRLGSAMVPNFFLEAIGFRAPRGSSIGLLLGCRT
jgi:hypothetical protein